MILVYQSILIFGLLCGSSAHSAHRRNAEGATIRMLDAMHHLMTGEPKFDRTRFKLLTACMEYLDPSVPAVQDGVWQGMIEYWNSNGTVDDRWGSAPSEFHECNITTTMVDNMQIYEPCNYASNLAYYRSMLELCLRETRGKPLRMPKKHLNRIGKAIAAMTPASSFFHGSNTKLGYAQDLSAISSIIYVAHQASMAPIPHNPVLHEVSLTPRKYNSIQIVDKLQDMYLNYPASKWWDMGKSVEQPLHFVLFAAFTLQVFAVNFKPKKTQFLGGMIVDSMNLTQEHKEVLLDHYLPELYKLHSEYTYPPGVLQRVRKNAMVSLMKFLHSLMYIESQLRVDGLLFNPVMAKLTHHIMPKLTKKFNRHTNYEYFQKSFQRTVKNYPDETKCNILYPHARWHALSALSVLDIVYVSDDFFYLYSRRKPRRSG